MKTLLWPPAISGGQGAEGGQHARGVAATSSAQYRALVHRNPDPGLPNASGTASSIPRAAPACDGKAL